MPSDHVQGVSRRDKRYMVQAIQESLNSTYARVNIGAVLVVGNYVVSKGANLDKAHPLQFKYNVKAHRPPSAHKLHAEVHALLKSKQFDLTGGTAYIGRLDRNGLPAMCRPCKACMLALRDAGIRTIFYSSRQGIKRERIDG